MKIRSSVWVFCVLFLSIGFCLYRIGDSPGNMTPLQSPDKKERKAELQRLFEEERNNNYKAKENNGSKRESIPLHKIPEPTRSRLAKLIAEYKEHIYPAMKAYAANNNGEVPIHGGLMPELAPFERDTRYKGTGPQISGRGSWSIGSRPRLDGTVISRDIYSKNPPDQPHDVWAEYTALVIEGHGEGYLVSGWDDGEATISRWEDIYFGDRKTLSGQIAGHAVPGQAGIPQDAIKTQEKWLNRKRNQAQK